MRANKSDKTPGRNIIWYKDDGNNRESATYLKLLSHEALNGDGDFFDFF